MELLRNLKDQLLSEKRKKYELLLKLRKDFVAENTKKNAEKKERDAKAKKEELDYRINYFPFTHGEKVEDKRRVDRIHRNRELQTYLSQTRSTHRRGLSQGWNQNTLLQS